MEKYPVSEKFSDMYDDRIERHFLMQLVKQDILSDECGEYVFYEERKINLTKPRPIAPKIGYNY